MMQIDLKGKRALVAGGSRGIGLSIAKAFAAAGADVAICARSVPSLDEAALALRGYGHKVSAHACDLSDEHAIKHWVEQAATDLGGVDILVNNASGFGRSDDEAGWALSLQIDVMSGVRCCAAALSVGWRRKHHPHCVDFRFECEHADPALWGSQSGHHSLHAYASISVGPSKNPGELYIARINLF